MALKGVLKVRIVSAEVFEEDEEENGPTTEYNTFVVIKFNNEERNTQVIRNTFEPHWNEDFVFQLIPTKNGWPEVPSLTLGLWDIGRVGGGIGQKFLGARTLNDVGVYLNSDGVPFEIEMLAEDGDDTAAVVLSIVLEEIAEKPNIIQPVSAEISEARRSNEEAEIVKNEELTSSSGNPEETDGTPEETDGIPEETDGGETESENKSEQTSGKGDEEEHEEEGEEEKREESNELEEEKDSRKEEEEEHPEDEDQEDEPVVKDKTFIQPAEDEEEIKRKKEAEAKEIREQLKKRFEKEERERRREEERRQMEASQQDIRNKREQFEAGAAASGALIEDGIARWETIHEKRKAAWGELEVEFGKVIKRKEAKIQKLNSEIKRLSKKERKLKQTVETKKRKRDGIEDSDDDENDDEA